MRIEPRATISGLKVAGVIALLASLLLLLPAASAGCYAMTLIVEADPDIASINDPVTFSYTLENTGDMDLYNVVVDGSFGVDPALVPVLEVGEEIVVEGTYTVSGSDVTDGGGYSYVLNEATATAKNYRGRTAVSSWACCTVLVE